MYRDTKEQSTLLYRDTEEREQSTLLYRDTTVLRYSSVVSRYRSVLCSFFRLVVCSALSLRCDGTEVCSALTPGVTLKKCVLLFLFFLQDKRDDESLRRQRCTDWWDYMSCLSEYVEKKFYTNRRAHSRKRPDI